MYVCVGEVNKILYAVFSFGVQTWRWYVSSLKCTFLGFKTNMTVEAT